MSKKVNEEIYAVQIIDKDKVGLHARPVAKIVAITNNEKFKTTTVDVYKLDDKVDLKDVILDGTEKKANGKSILSFIGLAVKHQNKIAFVIKGDHSEELVKQIKKVLKEEHLI